VIAWRPTPQRMTTPGFFVTGSDTGVGKTLASCALVAALRGRELSVGVMKPIETGVGAEGPLDAIALQRASDGRDPLSDICPERFALPAAPCVAASAEGRFVDLAAVRDAYQRVCAERHTVVVEGAGGILVPTQPDATMADLARELALPLIIVARTSLGTINHTLLTLEAADARGLRVAGVVLSHSTGPLSAADSDNLAYLRERIADQIVGEIPALAEGRSVSADHIATARLSAYLPDPPTHSPATPLT
jgi:dethiobiotin synthetase